MAVARTGSGSPRLALAALLLSACSEGGGCGGCGGEDSLLAPIPGGYPLPERIANAAQVRVTQTGLDFLESNVDPLLALAFPSGLDFAFTKQQVFDPPVFDPVTICDDDDCSAHIEVEGLTLTPKAPNRVVVSIRAIVDSRDASGPPGVKQAWDGTCDLRVDTRAGASDTIGIRAELELAEEAAAARQGYTYVRIVSVGADAAHPIESEDLNISGGILGVCGLGNFNFFKDFVLGLVIDPITEQLAGVLEKQRCTKPGESGCPAGTFSVLGDEEEPVCRYTNSPSARCVPRLLGVEGQADLGDALLGRFSSGTHGPMQFVTAAGGAGEAVSGGLSVFLTGGLRSTDALFESSPAHATCVPLVEAPALPTVARAALFRGNTIPGGGTSHVGIGLAEDFLNHAGYGIYDSGALCLAVGTRATPQISASLFSLLIRSLGRLTFPEENAAISIALRPGAPPSFEVGTGGDDALLTLSLPAFSADFYIFSQERYVRFMTFTGDVSIGLGLEPEGGKLAFAVSSLSTSNASVTNSELLAEDPGELAMLVENILTSFAGQIAKGIPPFELPTIMGFGIEVPDGGIRGVSEGEEEFVGIFANFIVEGGSIEAQAETEAELVSLDVDAHAVSLAGLGEAPAPSVTVRARAAGRLEAAFEYSHRVDGLAWSPWSADPVRVVSHPVLALQAEHRVEVRARVAGEPRSADESPAALTVHVDKSAPNVTLARLDGGVEVRAWDAVRGRIGLRYRVVDGGAPGEWNALTDGKAFVPVAFDDARITIEVEDGSGNIGVATAALIRGGPNPSRPESCDCGVPGGGPGNGSLGLLALVLGVLLRGRRRMRHGARMLPFLTLALLALLAGCSCSDEKKGSSPCGGDCPLAPPADERSASLCCEPMNMCIPYDRDSFCDPGYTCAVDALRFGEDCALACDRCEVKPALAEGFRGTHLGVTTLADGSRFVVGYADGDPPGLPYGDLVAGPATVEAGTGAVTVDWEIVDGAPDGPITNDPSGWRGGVSAPGDDVGRYASVVRSGETLFIAYYDRTSTALKFASGGPGAWAIHTVDDTGTAGLHATLTVDAEGKPVIAYARVDRDEADQPRGAVVVASATVASPAGSADWAFTPVATKTVPCRPSFCGDGAVCLETGACRMATADCSAECAGDEACVSGACEPILADPFVEDWPPILGLYADLERTPSGFALVYYDRAAGALFGARAEAGVWQAPFVIDGFALGADVDRDAGLGASLAVDGAGVWHLAYAEGTTESLRYARIEGANISLEDVDDGSTDGAAPFPDGRHVVGDDTDIFVTDTGELRIAYQDATAHTTRLARRAPSASGWTLSVLDAADHGGFWIRQAPTATGSEALFWWRGDAVAATSGLRAVAIP